MSSDVITQPSKQSKVKLFDEPVRDALRISLAITLATWLGLLLHFDAPFVCAITAGALSTHYAKTDFKKTLYRILASFIGAFIGLLLAVVFTNSYIAFLIICAAIVFLGQYLFYTTRHPYAFILGAATAFLIYGTLFTGTDSLYHTAVCRVAAFSLGAVVAWLVTCVIFPKKTPPGEEVKKSDLPKVFSFKMEKLILHRSIRMSLSFVLGFIVLLYLGMPIGIQGLIVALIIAQPIYAHDSMSHGVLRTVGSALGIGIGALAIRFELPSITILLLFIFVVSLVCAYVTVKSKKYSFMAIALHTTFLMTAIYPDGLTANVSLAFERSLGIFIGIFFVSVLGYFLWPEKQKVKVVAVEPKLQPVTSGGFVFGHAAASDKIRVTD